MLDNLKFWRKEEVPLQQERPSFDTMSDDPMRRNVDPLADASSDPLQRPDPFSQNIAQDSFQSGGREQYPTSGSLAGLRLQQSQQHDDEPNSVPQRYEELPKGRDRDTELVLAKLDAIKSELDSIHQRVRKIEQHSEARQRSW